VQRSEKRIGRGAFPSFPSNLNFSLPNGRNLAMVENLDMPSKGSCALGGTMQVDGDDVDTTILGLNAMFAFCLQSIAGFGLD